MGSDHESKLFIVEVEYFGRNRYKRYVHRTIRAANTQARKERLKKSVFAARVLPAQWGPDA